MTRKIFLYIFLLSTATIAKAQHPSLLITEEEVKEMRAAKGQVPAFDRTIDDLFRKADAETARPISLPIPKDGGGGPVHEQHKQNYYTMFHCGLAYQLSGERKYADYACRMLMGYAKLYPTLGLHPLTLSPVRGRLFWQTLNESVWLLHAAIAYDCIYDALTAKQRKTIEDKLLFNMADFLMNGYSDYQVNRKTFNRMHNHATWATAAVGMTGLATGNLSLVRKALYGSDETGKHGGFLQQMDELFSPDGYYTEGAYYQRYALWPFVIFAQCLDHRMPELDVFHRRGNILKKALDALIQLSYNGEFFHFNDALLKGLSAQEMVYAVNILYRKFPDSKSYLTVADRYQHDLLPVMGGYMIACDLQRGEAKPIVYSSQLFRDGRNGDQGALAVLRPARQNLNSAITLKATSHGMEHGHFDKLSIAYYDNGSEILTDYGASRFLNIEAKNEGHYTKENKTYAKQTVAHNTVTVDERSDYDGKVDVANQYHADIIYHQMGQAERQIVTAVDTTSYPGVRMMRTVAYLTVPGLSYPLILDVYQLRSATPHQYDYTLWYQGHFVSLNMPYVRHTTCLRPLGTKNGYQHIWLDGEGNNEGKDYTCFTFFQNDRFYSINMTNGPQTAFKLLKLGANDPDFNLLDRHGIMIRETQKKDHVFAVAIETHGAYDQVMETSDDLKSKCKALRIVRQDRETTEVEGVFDRQTVRLRINNQNGQAYVSVTE
ncbi:MAG: alginate lyase family protein [Prevotella sp.]|nr:alginate lyase family protein [Prevotella sp.]MDY4038339.1 alginate lyase family protein [Prevotella sp.]